MEAIKCKANVNQGKYGETLEKLRRFGDELQERINRCEGEEKDRLQKYYDEWEVWLDINSTTDEAYTWHRKQPWHKDYGFGTQYNKDYMYSDDSWDTFLHEYRHTMDENYSKKRTGIDRAKDGLDPNSPFERDAYKWSRDFNKRTR